MTDKTSTNLKPDVIVGYFVDEPSYQGPTVALLKHIEETHPHSSIRLVDFSRHTNSSSFAHVAKIFGIDNPLEYFIKTSPFTQWIRVPKKYNAHREIINDQFRDGVKSDLFSSLRTDPLPNGLLRKLIEREFISNGEKIYSSTVDILSNGSYGTSYILNGRHSANAAFWIACEEFGVSLYFWEAGTNFDSVYLCNHPVHDFFSNLDEAALINQELSIDDLEESKNRLDARVATKGETAFNRFWSSKRTARYLQNQKSRQHITYFSSSSDEYMSLGELSPPKLWVNQYEPLENLQLAASSDETKLNIRMHPNTIYKSAIYCFREVRRILNLGKKFTNIGVVWPSESVDSYELLKKSDLVLVSGSTVALESMHIGKPTYHLDHSAYFYASSKTMIDFTKTVEDLKKGYSTDYGRNIALVEIALQQKHERLKVEINDQVRTWNRFLSLVSYRNTFRVLDTAYMPVRKFINQFIFLYGKLRLSMLQIRRD